MKKLFLTLFFAVIGVAAMAQTLSIQHNVRASDGRQSMRVDVNYSVEGSGNADLVVYVCDMRGYAVNAGISGYSDRDGALCTYLLNQYVQTGNYRSQFYLPYEVLGRALQNGKWQVWFKMLDSNSGEEIMRSRNYPFTLNLN